MNEQLKKKGEDLKELMQKAKEAFEQLMPEEKAAHRREQAISWAFGQGALRRFEKGKPDFTEDEERKLRQHIADEYDKREAAKSEGNDTSEL